MSFKRVSAVMDIELSDGLAKWVLVTLAHHENSNTGHCFPSIDRLVKLTGLSRSTVIRCLKKLVDLRLIHKHPDLSFGHTVLLATHIIQNNKMRLIQNTKGLSGPRFIK